MRHELRNLDVISIENLQAGRITRQALHEAAKRNNGKYPMMPNIGMNTDQSSWEEMILADELNEMLEAARKITL